MSEEHRKPTIEELQKILNQPNCRLRTIILPNGQVDIKPTECGKEFAELEQKVKELEEWKQSAMKAFPDWQTIGKEIGTQLGHSVNMDLLPWIKKMKSQLAALKEENELLQSMNRTLESAKIKYHDGNAPVIKKLQASNRVLREALQQIQYVIAEVGYFLKNDDEKIDKIDEMVEAALSSTEEGGEK